MYLPKFNFPMHLMRSLTLTLMRCFSEDEGTEGAKPKEQLTKMSPLCKQESNLRPLTCQVAAHTAYHDSQVHVLVIYYTFPIFG